MIKVTIKNLTRNAYFAKLVENDKRTFVTNCNDNAPQIFMPLKKTRMYIKMFGATSNKYQIEIYDCN